MESRKIKLLVVDDHPLFRQGVIDSLSLEGDFIVLGQASYGKDALRLLRTEKIDIAILDLNLPEINGIEIAKTAKEEKIETKFLIMTGYDNRDDALKCLSLGVEGFLSKDLEPKFLSTAIRKISEGRYIYPGFTHGSFAGVEKHKDLLKKILGDIDASLRKFKPLGNYLRGAPIDQRGVTVSFKHVEKILGEPISSAARQNLEWWANKTEGMYIHARSWIDAGWKVDSVSLKEEWVRFVRAGK